MYIRFVAGTEDEHHRLLTGIFTECRFLKDDGILAPHEEQWLEDLYAWFNENLPCPPFGASNWPRDAVAWFKDDATDFVERMWEFVAMLKEHGVPVRMLRSQNPGKILWEDEFQAVVMEFKNL